MRAQGVRHLDRGVDRQLLVVGDHPTKERYFYSVGRPQRGLHILLGRLRIAQDHVSQRLDLPPGVEHEVLRDWKVLLRACLVLCLLRLQADGIQRSLGPLRQLVATDVSPTRPGFRHHQVDDSLGTETEVAGLEPFSELRPGCALPSLAADSRTADAAIDRGLRRTRIVAVEVRRGHGLLDMNINEHGFLLGGGGLGV